MRVLLIEDNAAMRDLIVAGLKEHGFTVDGCDGAEEGEAALRIAGYDALVLDLGLPDADGMTVLRDLRAAGQTLPVLILTARDGLADRVNGLNAGADDYLLKPFAMAELAARLHAMLRRPALAHVGLLVQGNVSLSPTDREARVDGAPLPLSRRELSALEALMRRADHVVPKETLEEMLYTMDETVSRNALEVLIHRLRKRLQTAGADITIHTLRGVGYLLSKTAP